MFFQKYISTFCISHFSFFLPDTRAEKDMQTESFQFRVLSVHCCRYVTACCFSPTSPLIATGSMDKTVNIWRLEDGCSERGGKHTHTHKHTHTPTPLLNAAFFVVLNLSNVCCLNVICCCLTVWNVFITLLLLFRFMMDKKDKHTFDYLYV